MLSRAGQGSAWRSSPLDIHRVAGRAEPGLGHADDRDAERRVCMRAQARAAAGIKIDLAVDDQQAKVAHRREHSAKRRQFPQDQFARPVRPHRWDQHRPLGLDG